MGRAECGDAGAEHCWAKLSGSASGGPIHCYFQPKIRISEGARLILPGPAMFSSMLQFIPVLAIMERVDRSISVLFEGFFPITDQALSLKF